MSAEPEEKELTVWELRRLGLRTRAEIQRAKGRANRVTRRTPEYIQHIEELTSLLDDINKALILMGKIEFDKQQAAKEKTEAEKPKPIPLEQRSAFMAIDYEKVQQQKQLQGKTPDAVDLGL